jgi:predicted MFS family arabinose efflux permease
MDAASGAGWHSLLLGRHGPLTVGLTLLTIAVATEALVVTTIMPAVVRDIGGLSFYGLAFSAFFLAGLVSIPAAGWTVDRHGPALPFAGTMAVFLAGTLVAALAPSMPVLVAGRAAQGFGASAQFTISQATIARAYPSEARVRMLSVMSASWTLPTLVGPALGALVTGLWGWRWAFGVIVVPTVAAAAVTFPRLRQVRPAAAARERPSLVSPVLLAVGTGMALLGLTGLSWPAALVAAIGCAVGVQGLRGVVPPGTFALARGLPAAIGGSFFLTFGYYAASSFVPLVLVALRGFSIAQAAPVVVVGSLAWSAGVALNTALVRRFPAARIVRWSTVALGLGILAFAAVMFGAPVAASYLAWPAAGFGMGIALNTLVLQTMAAAEAGGEGGALGARNLVSNLGTAVGTGVTGAAVALSQHSGLGLRTGLAAGFAMVLASLAVLVAASPRVAAGGPRRPMLEP